MATALSAEQVVAEAVVMGANAAGTLGGPQCVSGSARVSRAPFQHHNGSLLQAGSAALVKTSIFSSACVRKTALLCAPAA